MPYAPKDNLKNIGTLRDNLKMSNDRRQTVQFMADMLMELRNMAKHHEFHTLQGLLEISYYEAFSIAHKTEIPAGEEELLALLGADARKAAKTHQDKRQHEREFSRSR